MPDIQGGRSFFEQRCNNNNKVKSGLCGHYSGVKKAKQKIFWGRHFWKLWRSPLGAFLTKRANCIVVIALLLFSKVPGWIPQALKRKVVFHNSTTINVKSIKPMLSTKRLSKRVAIDCYIKNLGWAAKNLTFHRRRKQVMREIRDERSSVLCEPRKAVKPIYP